MPRTIYDPITGADVSSSVFATLRAGNTFVVQYLYRFQCMDFWDSNAYGNYADFTFTDADFPIFINMYQTTPTEVTNLGIFVNGVNQNNGLTFTPEVISHEKLDYAVGLEDKPIDIVWRYNEATNYGNFSVAAVPPNLTMRQAMLLGGFQEVPFWIHAAIFTDFPDRGGTFLGTSLMFRGYLRKVESTKDGLKLGVTGLMDVFQTVKIPTQIITPNNRSVFILVATPGPNIGFGLLDALGVASSNGPVVNFTKSLGSWSATRDVLKDCYMTFAPFMDGTDYPYLLLPTPGFAPAPVWKIAGNDPSTSGILTVYFYTTPVVPNAPYFNLFGQNTQVGLSGTQGFPYVPTPEILFM